MGFKGWAIQYVPLAVLLKKERERRKKGRPRSFDMKQFLIRRLILTRGSPRSESLIAKQTNWSRT